MRYRDSPTVQVEESIVGDTELIWQLVTDIEFPTRFSSELQSVEWLDGATTVEVGNRFRGHNKNDDLGEWATDCEIIEATPLERWVWQIASDNGVMATWGFELDPGRDAVTVRQWARMGPGPSGLTGVIASMPEKEGRIVSGRMKQWQAGMRANLAGIKSLVETP